MKASKKVGVFAAAAVALMLATGAAGSRSRASYAHFYVQEVVMDQNIEQYGFTYRRRHLDADNALCTGLRRYGTTLDPYGGPMYWRFKCEIDGANGHIYDGQYSTTHGPNRRLWYLHQLSMVRFA